MNAKQKLAEMNARAAALYKADGKTMSAFRGLMVAANREGKVGPAMKEMIAIAVAIGRGCEDCIVFHASEAKAHGASARNCWRCWPSPSRCRAGRARSMRQRRWPPSTSCEVSP